MIAPNLIVHAAVIRTQIDVLELFAVRRNAEREANESAIVWDRVWTTTTSDIDFDCSITERNAVDDGEAERVTGLVGLE